MNPNRLPWNSLRAAAWGSLLWLVFSMALSSGYALRSFFPFEALSIPEMRAWHGTANALGVAGFGLAGWLIAMRRRHFSVKC